MTEQLENNALAAERFSEREIQLVLTKAWELWKRQAQHFCGLDSTSLSVERAEALLRSALYTVSLAEGGSLPQDDPEKLLVWGQDILRQRTADAKADWQRLIASPPPVQNIFFRHTATALASFFSHYEIYYEAHLIPCDITYSPMCPVPEELLGVSFVGEYLHRLRWETQLLRCFAAPRLRGLYQSYLPHFKDMLFNLCEPVLWNAIGLALLRKNIFLLTVTAQEQQMLLRLLRGKQPDTLHLMVNEAAGAVCRSAGIRDAEAREYFLCAAGELIPHLYAAVSGGSLCRVFLQFNTSDIRI